TRGQSRADAERSSRSSANGKEWAYMQTHHSITAARPFPSRHAPRVLVMYRVRNDGCDRIESPDGKISYCGWADEEV
ncbi:MAG: hypothetical protein AB7V27_07425, partial [Candidatus Binatia bacterium]